MQSAVELLGPHSCEAILGRQIASNCPCEDLVRVLGWNCLARAAVERYMDLVINFRNVT